MATSVNTIINNSVLISNSKNTVEEQKSQVLCKSSVSITVPSTFWQKQDNQIHNDLSHNFSTKIEEVKTLQINTNKLQQEVDNLEYRAIYKKSKIEDLRNLIERISDEDHYFDRTLDHKRYFNFVKSFNYSSSYPKKKHRFEVDKRECNDHFCCRTISSESSETTDTTDNAEEGDGGKPDRAIQRGFSTSNNDIDYCLLYWSSAFPVNNKNAINI